jgi:Ca2+-binding EF-hand superfamily protein
VITQRIGFYLKVTIIGGFMVSNVSNSSYDRTAMTSQMAQKMFKKIDSNSDGGIDKTELEAIAGSSSTTDISKLFSKMDANSDGKIDQSENESALQKLAQKMESAFSRMNGAGGMQKPPPDASTMFSKLDTDSSGGISEDEFSSIAKKGEGKGPEFSSIDSDGDGSISETENEEFMKSMGPPPGPPPSGMGQMGGARGASKSDSFTDLLSALESAVSDDEDDETTSSIQQLFNELKSNIKYSAQGSKSYSMSGTESLFSLTA